MHRLVPASLCARCGATVDCDAIHPSRARVAQPISMPLPPDNHMRHLYRNRDVSRGSRFHAFASLCSTTCDCSFAVPIEGACIGLIPPVDIKTERFAGLVVDHKVVRTVDCDHQCDNQCDASDDRHSPYDDSSSFGASLLSCGSCSLVACSPNTGRNKIGFFCRFECGLRDMGASEPTRWTA